MRLKKQSMREVFDAGVVARAENIIREAIANPLAPINADKPRYFRGALVKPKPETKDNGN